MTRLIDADALYDAINKSELVLDFREVVILNDLIANALTVQREGWVSVPIEPAEEMIELFFNEMGVLGYSASKIDLTIDELKQCYKAMIQAAPKE